MKKINIKDIVISSVSFILFVVVLFYIFMDGFGKKGSHGVSGFIEQDNLRKTLGDWYQLVFWTFQVNIWFLIIGILWFFLKRNKIIQNMFFCSASYLLFCLFAMSVFEFKSFKTNAYESSKTLFVHCIIPIISFIMLLSVRKEISLQWKWLFINSLYVTFYIILTLIIYYNFNFAADSQYPNKPLWIYGFLDYNNQIMFVPLPNMTLTILGICGLLILTPGVGMVLFLFIKFIFFIKIEPKIKKANLEL